MYALSRKRINTDEPTPAGKYLGCTHRVFEQTVKPGQQPRHPVLPPDPSCRSGKAMIELLEKRALKSKTGSITIRCIEYDMSDFFQSCVVKYLKLSKVDKSRLKPVETPFLEDLPEEENAPAGDLKPIANNKFMKILYGARVCRYDLLRAVCVLATKDTTWTKQCDRQLHRLMCYINQTLDHRLHA